MVDKNRREGDSQILLLQQKLDNHIDDYHMYCAAEDKRWDKFISTQESNTASIKELVAICEMVKWVCCTRCRVQVGLRLFQVMLTCSHIDGRGPSSQHHLHQRCLQEMH